MKLTSLANSFRLLVCLSLAVISFSSADAYAQRRRVQKPNPAVKRTISAPKRTAPVAAVVVDDQLAVLRLEPDLSSIPLQRMRRGRTVLISGSRETEGVTFYRAQLPPEREGWIQADAVVTSSKRGDDLRLANLIRASSGFEQIERAAIFLETFSASPLRPAILLLMGDLLEENAQRLSREAIRRLNMEEIKASGAPLHSFYLNYNGLDRYRRLGINFVFNREARQFHYDGASWREILQKHSKSAEAAEAKKRLDDLAAKMKS